MGENTKQKTPLLPDRYPIQDFFVCDVTDAIPKDDMGSMEHLILSLSTRPDKGFVALSEIIDTFV